MATNPMKKREQNAFLIGIVIGLIGVVLTGFLLYRLYSNTKKEFEQYKADQEAKIVEVVVAASDIKANNELTEENITTEKVMIQMDSEAYFLSTDEILFEEDVSVDAKEGDQLKKVNVAKVDIPAGTVLTKDLFMDSDEKQTDDVRLHEYSCFTLPSQLSEGDYIDIRMTLPTGQDFIVLPKKKVLKCDANTVWMKVDESEILIMNSAMVEAYTMTGTRFYSLLYTDAGLQTKAIATYQPAPEVMVQIKENPNIVKEAREALQKTYSDSRAAEFREEYINKVLGEYIDGRDGAASSVFGSEDSAIQQHRTEYIESLEETE